MPRVVIHNAVSLDGRVTGFEVDLGRYYGLVPTWHEDATLCGSGTILAAPEGRIREKLDDSADREVDPRDKRPLLVVADGRGRVRCWSMLLATGYWRDGIALCSSRTANRHLEYLGRRGVNRIIAGEENVDLRRALAILRRRYRVRTVRTDSGGILNAALSRDGLVDELSLLVHPVFAGASARPLFAGAEPLKSPFRLFHQARLPGGLFWLRYRAVRSRVKKQTY